MHHTTHKSPAAVVRSHLGDVLFLSMLSYALGAPLVAQAAPKPEVVVLASRVEGQIDATASLTRGLNGANQKLLACYNATRAKNPSLVGELNLDASISRAGKITQTTRTSGSNVGDDVETCMTNVLKGLTLSPWPLKHNVVAVVSIQLRLVGVPPKGFYVVGGLKGPFVAGSIESMIPEIASCLPTQRPKRLLLMAVVNIAYDGHVYNAKILGKGISGKVKRCMSKVIGDCRFPKSARGHRTYTQYPLRFPATTSSTPSPSRAAPGEGARKRSTSAWK